MAARLMELRRLSAQLFNQVWNPESKRLGTKILSQRLMGDVVTSYYPKRFVELKDVTREFKGMGLFDRKEAVRLEDVERRRRRGKGAPKKGQGKRKALGKKK